MQFTLGYLLSYFPFSAYNAIEEFREFVYDLQSNSKNCCRYSAFLFFVYDIPYVKAENEKLITSPHGVLMEASTGRL